MYYFPQQPPYALLVFGLFIAITSGAALSGTLQRVIQEWQIAGAENSGLQFSKKPLIFPFLGVMLGTGLFLTCGLEIFGFPPLIAIGVGLALGLMTSALMWVQLGSLMKFVETRGMRSLDLDSLS